MPPAADPADSAVVSHLVLETVAVAGSFPVSAPMLEQWQSRSPSLLWKVTALAEGRVLAASAPQVLVVP